MPEIYHSVRDPAVALSVVYSAGNEWAICKAVDVRDTAGQKPPVGNTIAGRPTLALSGTGQREVKTARRKAIPVSVQLEVFFRDRWLCHVCRRPLVFPFALKQLAELVGAEGSGPFPSYFNLNWRRDRAPLLDELGASIDHVHAWSAGGADAAENLAAICSRCNVRKSASPVRSREEVAGRPAGVPRTTDINMTRAMSAPP